MSTWVRINGQRELRENVRALLKEAGLSRRAAAERAGVKYNSLVGLLSTSNSCWFRVEDAFALAKMFELSLDELTGNSIFKGDRERYAEFDHLPPEWRRNDWAEKEAALAEERRAELAAGRTRALCCECGALRTCAANRHRWEPSLDSGYRPRDGHRVTEQMKCFECRKVTRHAVLLLSEERDAPEDADRRPSRHALATMERDRLIERLREFNVAITWRRGYSKKKDSAGTFYSSGYEFNSNTMRWEISLDANMPPRLQVEMIKDHWASISTEDHGVDWDPRSGVWISPGRDAWNAVADDLLRDVERFLHVERTRMTMEFGESACGDSERQVDQ